MRKILTAALAALTIGGAVVATAAPASAHDGWGGRGGYDHDRGYGGGLALGAGLLGLAVGASLAEPHYGYGYGYAQPRVYYGGPAYYGYARPSYYGNDRECHTVWRWDPYEGRNVPVERCY